MTDIELDHFIQEKVAQIMEHANSCQIMIEWSDDRVCKSMYRGGGSWFSRKGMCLEFMEIDQARATAHELDEVLNPPDEDCQEDSHLA